MKVVPSPGVDSTQITPPLWLTMPCTVASPSPVPSPIPFVVKNGSKIFSTRLGRHPDAGVAHGERHVRPRLEVRVRTLVVLAEFECAVSDREPATVGHRVASVESEIEHDLFDLGRIGSVGPRSESNAVERTTSSPSMRPTSSPCHSTISFRSISCGRSTCLRLNASSWPVSEAALPAARAICSALSRVGTAPASKSISISSA